jgi:hypothetical protein
MLRGPKLSKNEAVAPKEEEEDEEEEEEEEEECGSRRRCRCPSKVAQIFKTGHSVFIRLDRA